MQEDETSPDTSLEKSEVEEDKAATTKSNLTLFPEEASSTEPQQPIEVAIPAFDEEPEVVTGPQIPIGEEEQDPPPTEPIRPITPPLDPSFTEPIHSQTPPVDSAPPVKPNEWKRFPVDPAENYIKPIGPSSSEIVDLQTPPEIRIVQGLAFLLSILLVLIYLSWRRFQSKISTLYTTNAVPAGKQRSQGTR
mmetsp:Transcript_10367/g.13475  ORF Transcript_10367/g.13475 Transcript_10367/m.13475 type:complete len:192 (-) Transcript_10367:315-890(-)|eukprot:CAMPEP_0117746440 /NCGR_PEP_ID=MMETSP0947-20121206/7948_1 /TAXON_ID=44440 /ORGANISM="Chattonella subsalsa, Strain CCMP2191" /LENGTH=191 /DNA_ID=CAMNT_0005563765 /DNA_START=127 /DNA_END=702 /DNA_ORIENTATION=+